MKKTLFSLVLTLTCFIATAQLAAPTLYSPADNLTGAWTRQDFQWTKVTNATGYTFQIDTTASFDSPLLYEATQSSTSSTYQSRIHNNMRYGTTYYWRVRAYNATDTSAWSTIRQLLTTDRVVLDSPSNDTSSTSGWYSRQEFSWRNSKGSTSYILQLDTTPDFNSPILRSFTKTNSQSNTDTYVSYVVNDMRYGTMHYWRVCAINTVDTSGWSDTWQFHTTDRVVLNSPSNNTTGTDSKYTRQEFQWRNSKGSSSYILQLDTTPDFNSPILRSFTKTNSQSNTDTYVSYVVNDMRYGTIYYWRVCAINTVDTSGWSDTWQFHTTDRVILNSPSNNTTGTDSKYTRQQFQWYNSRGSSGYILQLDTTQEFNSLILRSFTSTNSQSNTDTYFSYIVNDMRYGTTYYWRVCAINAVDTSGWSETWQFHTTDRVVLRGPANNSTGQSVSSTQLSWNNSLGSTSYLVQWDTSSTFSSSLLDSYTVTASYTSTADYFYKNISGLRYGTTYYWRVCSANNAPDTSGWSDTWQFTTSYQLTTGPVLTAPTNDTVGIPYNSNLAFSWQPIENVQGYYYQISTSNDFSTIIAQGNTSLTFTSVSNFSPTTTYYWRVRGYNNSGNSVWSQVWHFTTNDVVLTPPVLVSPANDATVQTSDVTLMWQNVFGANSYELQFSMDANFVTAVTNFTTTSTQYSLTGIPDNTTLYWRVRATNGNTYSDWSAPWHFTTNECQTSSYAFSHSICNGESYEFFGQTLTTSGDYSQVLTNADGCDSIVTLHLTVFPTESTEFSETAFDSYTWNGQTYTESGDYTQTLTNIHGCDSIVTLHLTLTVGIDNWTENSVIIYPNPTQGKLKIENGDLKIWSVGIVDVYGKLLRMIAINDNMVELDLSSYTAGVYFLKIDTPNGEVVRKVVKR